MLTNDEVQSAKTYALSPHFTLFEAIHSEEHPDLVKMPHSMIISECKDFAGEVLEPFREECNDGKPLKINSWYRNPQLNAAVGGVTNSIHQIYLPQKTNSLGLYLGVAADVVPVDLYAAFKKTAKWANEEVKTFILYPKKKFIHMDTSNQKSDRVWMISMTGKSYTYVPADQVETIEAFLKAQFNFEV